MIMHADIERIVQYIKKKPYYSPPLRPVEKPLKRSDVLTVIRQSFGEEAAENLLMKWEEEAHYNEMENTHG